MRACLMGSRSNINANWPASKKTIKQLINRNFVVSKTEITIRYDAVRSAVSLFPIGSATALPNHTLSCTGSPNRDGVRPSRPKPRSGGAIASAFTA